MSQTAREAAQQVERRLHAYHDGELSGFARWRFERTLRRSPALQRELRSLQEMAELMRDSDAQGPSADLWDRIALRLPALDAQRGEVEPEDAVSPRRWASATWWLKPVGAVAATAGLALAVFEGFFDVDARPPVVRWVDSGEKSVMVIEDDADATIIWVLDTLNEGAAMGGGREVV